MELLQQSPYSVSKFITCGLCVKMVDFGDKPQDFPWHCFDVRCTGAYDICGPCAVARMARIEARRLKWQAAAQQCSAGSKLTLQSVPADDVLCPKGHGLTLYASRMIKAHVLRNPNGATAKAKLNADKCWMPPSASPTNNRITCSVCKEELVSMAGRVLHCDVCHGTPQPVLPTARLICVSSRFLDP
jgi:hypothetical protein